MTDIDYTTCPKCGDKDNTMTYDDWIHELGYTRRICDSCDTYYKVYFDTVATKVEIEEK